MDSVASASLSDGASPTSPLQDAGDDTEAALDLFQLNAFNSEATGEPSSMQPQDDANNFAGISRLLDEPNVMQEHAKRRKEAFNEIESAIYQLCSVSVSRLCCVNAL